MQSESRTDTATPTRGASAHGAGLVGGLRERAEQVAVLAQARRGAMLRTHRFRLRWEDLEDCYAQASFELVRHALQGGRFVSRQHLENVLEQRFVSRIHDHRRAVEGRSPARAMAEGALPLEIAGQPLDIADSRMDPQQLVLLREELRRLPQLAGALSRDQRLVLASQLAEIPGAEVCSRLGWSSDKYRKVAQRGRARLRALVADEDMSVPNGRRRSDPASGTCR